MSNLINYSEPNPDIRMYPVPQQRDLADIAPIEVAPAAEALTQQAYIDAISAPDLQPLAIESAQPATPIREGGAGSSIETLNEQAVQNIFDRPETKQAVQHATQHVFNAYDTSPEALAARAHSEQMAQFNRAAHERTQRFGASIENLRQQALEGLN